MSRRETSQRRPGTASRGAQGASAQRLGARPRPAARWRLPAAALLILLVGIGAYANSFHGVFVLDEQSAIVENPNIRTIASSFSAPKEVGFAGRPVVSLSFALNYLLAPADAREVFAPPPPGGDPAAADAFFRNLWGYHAVNLAIHLLAALALFGIVRRTLLLLGSPKPSAEEPVAKAAAPGAGKPAVSDLGWGASTALASIVALLWVAHPLNTGSITYVAQRVESLMGMFFLLTLYCAIRAGESWLGRSRERQASDGQSRDGQSSDPPSGGFTLSWTAGAIAFCALGMGTKEVMAAAPVIVLLYDYVFFARSRGWWRFRLPLYAGFAACWVLLAVLVVSNPRGASIGIGLQGWSSWLYLETQAGVIVHYLRLAVLPWPLVLDYEWPAAASLASVLPQMLFLAALFALTVWGLVRRWPAAFLGAWFFLILAPSSSLLPIVTEIAAEHRMYLPLCAVIALVVIGGYRVGERVTRAFGGATAGERGDGAPGDGERGRSPYTWIRAAGVVLAAAAVAGCAYLTRARNDDYSSYERIWADTVAKRPDNARARSNYGTVLFEAGRLQDAEAQLRQAVALRERYPEAQANLGAVLCSEGRLEDGIEHLRRAIALEPGYRDAYRNLGEALATLGRNAEALQAYRKALETAPDDPRLLSRVAWLLATSPEGNLRDGRAAIDYAERAVQITEGRDADSLDTLAAAYAEQGRFNDAVTTEERAMSVAQASGQGGLLPDMQMRLEMFRAGQKFRQAPLQRG